MHYTHIFLSFFLLSFDALDKSRPLSKKKKVEENKFQREKGRVVSSLFEEIIFCGGGEIFFLNSYGFCVSLSLSLFSIVGFFDTKNKKNKGLIL